MLLSDITVFVGGPIQYACNGGTFAERVRAGLTVLHDALESVGASVLSAHRYENFGEMDVTNLQREVCARDYKWMKTCDVFVAFLPDGEQGPIRTDGTCVELGWASALGKSVLIIRSKKYEHSHLVSGLEAIARVDTLDLETAITAPNSVTDAVCKLIEKNQGIDGEATVRERQHT